MMIAYRLIPSKDKFVSSELVSSMLMGESVFVWGNSKRRTEEFVFCFFLFISGAGFEASGAGGVEV